MESQIRADGLYFLKRNSLFGPLGEEVLLEVVAHLRNRENRRIEVQANCIFKGQNGFTTGDETPFMMVILTENGTEDVTFVSMNNLSILKTNKARAIRFSTLEAICKALHCQPGDLFQYVDDKEETAPPQGG